MESTRKVQGFCRKYAIIFRYNSVVRSNSGKQETQDIQEGNRMERAVFYARVSTQEEAQLRALPKQIQECKDTIAENKWKLIDGYIDEGKSGTQVAKRTEYQRLLNDIAEDKFDIVVVKSQDRLQRNPGDWYIFIDKLIKHGKRLYLYLERKFFEPSEDALITGIKAILAAEYSRDLSKKLSNSAQRRIEKVRNGENVTAMGTNMCYGYYIENGEWKVDHEQAKITKLIYQLYLKYDSIRKVVDEINAQGYRNQRGGLFCADSVARILKNPRYKGTLVVNRFHRDFDSKTIVENPPEEWVTLDDAFEAVVTAEEWEEVNKRLAVKKNGTRGKNVSRDPLGGKLICSRCGAPLWRHKSNGYYGWYCSQKYSRGKEACVGTSISQKTLELIYKGIGAQLEVHREVVKRSMLEWLKELQRALSADSDYEKYAKDLERLKAEEGRLVDKYVEGKIPSEIYDRKFAELEAKIAGIQAKFVPLEENEDLKDIQAVIDNIDTEIDNWIASQDFDEQRIDFLTEHTKKVTVNPEKVVIIELDLVGGAILAGKDFLLYVRESMPVADVRICHERSCPQGRSGRRILH